MTRHKLIKLILSGVAILGLIVVLAIAKPALAKRPVFIFGHAPFVISSPSMEPSYRTHSLVIVKKVGTESLKAGDVIAFRADALGGGLALHRITRITPNGIFTKGDGNSHEDNQPIGSPELVGKCVMHFGGFARIINALSTAKGKILLLVFPVLTAMLVVGAGRVLKKG